MKRKKKKKKIPRRRRRKSKCALDVALFFLRQKKKFGVESTLARLTPTCSFDPVKASSAAGCESDPLDTLSTAMVFAEVEMLLNRSNHSYGALYMPILSVMFSSIN